MYRTTTATINLERPPEGNDVYARLNWLVAANAHEAERRALFRRAGEEDELLLMRRPYDIRRAYALLGLLLGLLPPAAIFIRLFGYGLSVSEHSALLFVICLLMNFVCAGVGYVTGAALSSAMWTLERDTWLPMLLLAPLIGTSWGMVTGGLGGLLFFGIGAFFGAAFAIPIGAFVFALFSLFHRLLARGGMIDARHYWPLASGLSLFVAALVLGV